MQEGSDILLHILSSAIVELQRNGTISNREDKNMKTKRIEKLVSGMTSFSKKHYHKSELLNEMFALQAEIVEAAFSEEHAATADLRIWDVERHLEQLNEGCGHVADEELQRFKDESKVLCNMIKAEISGNRGEYKAFKTLEYLRSQNRVLRNVELQDGANRSELDAVVITPKCLTIVEVKNTSKNIFIDEEGNYYRTGEFLKWDCNIAEKMALKEELLRITLKKAGIVHVQIRSVVVFTNNRIEVQNKYSQIRTCFVSQLAYIIDGFRMEDTITEIEMDAIQVIIEAATNKESYPFDFDVLQYKVDFATLLATLEFEKAKLEEADEIVEAVDSEKVTKIQKYNISNWLRRAFASKQAKYAGSAAAVAVTIASSLIVSNTINKGGVQL